MKNIVRDSLSQLPNNGNQNTTHESNYTMETMSEINYKGELSEGTFPIKFYKLTNINGNTLAWWISFKPVTINSVIFVEEVINV